MGSGGGVSTAYLKPHKSRSSLPVHTFHFVTVRVRGILVSENCPKSILSGPRGAPCSFLIYTL